MIIGLVSGLLAVGAATVMELPADCGGCKFEVADAGTADSYLQQKAGNPASCTCNFLNLKGNRYGHYIRKLKDNGAFNGVRITGALLMMDVGLTTIEDGAFNGITIFDGAINMSGNQITDVSPDALTGIGGGLVRVLLGGNKIRELNFKLSDKISELELGGQEDPNAPSYGPGRRRFPGYPGGGYPGGSGFPGGSGIPAPEPEPFVTFEVPMFAGTAANLKSLYLNELQLLDSITADMFADMTSLTRLELYDNKIPALPEGIFDALTALEHLTLDDNELTEFPKELIANCKQLNYLTIARNQLVKLEAMFLKDGPAPSQFSVAGNQLKYVPQNLLSKSGSDYFADLDFSDNQLKEVPGVRFLEGVTYIGYLQFQNNQISSLPDNFIPDDEGLYIEEFYLNDNLLDGDINAAMNLPGSKTEVYYVDMRGNPIQCKVELGENMYWYEDPMDGYDNLEACSAPAKEVCENNMRLVKCEEANAEYGCIWHKDYHRCVSPACGIDSKNKKNCNNKQCCKRNGDSCYYNRATRQCLDLIPPENPCEHRGNNIPHTRTSCKNLHECKWNKRDGVCLNREPIVLE